MALLVGLRWPDGVRCPRCGNDKVFKVEHRPWSWVCKSGKESVNEQTGEVRVCKKNGYRFSALVGTVFRNTNYPSPSGSKSSSDLPEREGDERTPDSADAEGGAGPPHTRPPFTFLIACEPYSTTISLVSRWALLKWTKPISAERKATSVSASAVSEGELAVRPK